MSKTPEYDARAIHLSPFPRPVDVGHGWWQKTWEVTMDPPTPTIDLHLSSLAHDVEDRPFIVVVLPEDSGRITVEVFATMPHVLTEEMVYIAFVMRALRAASRHFSINGDSNHGVLNMVRPID